MKNILMVLPIVSASPLVPLTQQAYSNVEGVDIVGIENGVDPLMRFVDVELNVPAILNRLVAGEKEGYKAACIGCFDDPDILSFVKCFEHRPDPDSDFPKHFPGELRVTLRDGREVSKRIVASKGSPEWPMTRSEVEAKFMNHAERVMSRDRASRIIELVFDLENVTDVAKILDATIADLG